MKPKTKFKQTEIGMIPEGWEVVKFSGLIKLKHGHQFRQYDFTQDGIRVFKITQIKEDGSIDISSCSFVDKNRKEEFKEFLIKKGDILMALTGATIGKIARVRNDYGVLLQNYRVGNFLPKDENHLSKDYLYFFLSSKIFLNQILARQTQSAQQNIGKEEINNMLAIIPPLPEQRAIAKILSDLDSKIELNQQMNKTLEAIGQALFKHWFIDFEFPNEEGKPYKSSGGEMVYNEELGKEVPKGWVVKRLKDIVLRLGPGTNFQPERVSTGIPFLNVKNISNGFLDLKDVKYISDKDFEWVHKSWKPEEHDVLISRIGTLGNVAIIRKEDLPLSVHYNIIDVKPKNTSHALLYFLFISDFFQNEYHLRKVQTVQEYITIENVEEIKIAIPEKDDLKMFDGFFIGLMNKMEANFMEIQTLSTIRDSLLPKLMSGKIRVPVEVRA